tara:strand:+ start:279 stop:485 length:207 start_codon:yes stop_codon:yes gene_type:complete
MFYYFSIIVIPLMIETTQPILERSVTGPFETLELCLAYEEVIQAIPRISPQAKILQSQCRKEIKRKAV